MSTKAPGGVRSAGRSALILVITLLAVVAFAILYPMPSPLITTICEDTGWDLGQAGNMVGIFALVMAFATFTTSTFIDHLGLKKTALLSCAFAGIGGILSFWGGGSYPFHLAARLIAGIGYGLFCALSPAIISQRFSQSRQAFLQGLRASCDFAGGSLAYLIIVPIAHLVNSWQATFGIMGIVCAVLFLLYLLFYQEAPQAAPASGEVQAEAAPGRGQSSIMRAVRQKWVWLITLSQLFKGITYNVFTIYLPTFLEVERGFSTEAASYMASIPHIAGLITGLLAGTVSSALGRRKILGWPMILLVALGGGISILMENTFLIALGSFLMGCGVCGHMVFYTTVPGDITQGRYPGIVAASLAFTLGLGFGIGALVPALFQVLVDAGISLGSAMLILTVPCLLGMIPAALIRETGPNGKYARRGELPYPID